MTIEEVEDVIYGWLYNIVGINTIFANQMGERPNSLYATINILNISQVGEGDYSDLELSVLDDFTVSINFYYSGALNIAKNAKMSLETLVTNEYLYGNGLGFKTISDIRKIPIVVKSKWEERAQFDINFYVVSTTSQSDPGTIEKIEVNDILIEE